MAKRFTYRLDPLLRLKTHRVNEAKEALSQVVHIRVEKEQLIDGNQNYYKDLIGHEVRSSKAADMQALVYHKTHIIDEIDRLETEKQQVTEIEALKRYKLTEAMKEERILEKLKEKKKHAYDLELKKEEMQFLDEIALTRHEKTEFTD